MSVYAGPEIVNDGLILSVDAANSKSYPGSGSTWFDLSGNGNHLTLIGSPVFTSGVVQFNGTTQYAQNDLNLATGTSTYMGAARYSGTIKGRIFTSKNNNYLLGHYGGASTENLFAEGWVTGPGVGSNDTNWRILAATNNVTSDIYSMYVNGSLTTSNGNGAAGPNGIAIARNGFYGEMSQCEVSFVLAYNRVLSTAEVIQNFNALRGRFGI